MLYTRIPKAVVWGTRFFQLALAIILLGVLSYIIDEFREFTRSGEPPREVVIAEIFSVLAVVFTAFGIAAVFFLGIYAQLAAALLDFCIFVGYITSAGLLRHNYGSGDDRNPLERSLNAFRRFHGIRGHQTLNRQIVELVSVLVVIQIILYFCTTVLSIVFALGSRTAAAGGYRAERNRSRFSVTRANSEKWAVPLSAF